MLYLPTGWWHEVTSLATDERGPAQHVAVNYWFHPPDNLDPSAKGFGRPYRWVRGLAAQMVVGMVHFAEANDPGHIPTIFRSRYLLDEWKRLYPARAASAKDPAPLANDMFEDAQFVHPSPKKLRASAASFKGRWVRRLVRIRKRALTKPRS